MSLAALIYAVRRARWVREELPSQERRLTRNSEKVDELTQKFDGKSMSAKREIIMWQDEVDNAARQVILLTEEAAASRSSFLTAEEVAGLMSEIPSLAYEDARQLPFLIKDADLSAQAKDAFRQNFYSRFSW